MTKDEMKKELKRLFNKDPALFEGIVSEFSEEGLTALVVEHKRAGRKQRPGKTEPRFWALVQSIRELHAKGSVLLSIEKACQKILDSGHDVIYRLESDGTVQTKLFVPRDAASMKRDFGRANKAYKSDPEFRFHADMHLAMFRIVHKEGIHEVEAWIKLNPKYESDPEFKAKVDLWVPVLRILFESRISAKEAWEQVYPDREFVKLADSDVVRFE